jgi:pilus assembly protein CpaE
MKTNGPRVAAVGGPPTFHPQVARALSSLPDAIEWIPSVIGAESALLGAAEPFDLLVVSPIVPEADAAGVAHFVSRQSPTTAVVVVRDRVSNGSLPALIRAGVRDVVDLSKGADDLREALHRALEWTEGLRSASGDGTAGEAARQGRLISVFSTKGGTGKTFIACNLAAALSSLTNQRTALLDLDLRSGDVFAYFGAESKRSVSDLMTLEEGSDRELVPALGTPLAGGVIGFGSPADPGAEPIGTEAMSKVLRTLRSSFAQTVVDATSTYSDHVLAALELSDVICMVTGLDVIGVRHLSLGMQTLEDLGIPRDRFRIVLNRADSKVDLTPENIERVLRMKVNARIPSSILVPKSINRSRLLWIEQQRSPVAKSITVLADGILAQTGSAPQALVAAAPKRKWRR